MAISSMARPPPACSSRATCWSRRPPSGRVLPVTSSASPTRRPPRNERTPIEGLPETDANGAATFPVSLAKPPSSTRPQEAQIFIRMAEAGGRAVERKLVLPVAPATAMIGVKPLFSATRTSPKATRPSFDVVFVSPEGKPLARDGLRYELLKIESRYQWYRQNSSWEYEPVKSTSRVADGDLTVTADKPRGSRCRRSPAAIGST